MFETTADKFIGGELYALKPSTIYTRPDGEYVRQVEKGDYVGRIYSYAVRGSDVWWQLTYFDNPNFLGYVRHEQGKFDQVKLAESLVKQEQEKQKRIQEKVDERLDNKKIKTFGDFLEEMFGKLNDFIWPIVVLLVIMLLFNLSKK